MSEENVYELIEKVKKLSQVDRITLLKELATDDNLSINDLIIARVAHLEDFKNKAKQDVVTVAQAGMELAEKEMLRVTKVGGRPRKKDDYFRLAMVKCLMDAGAFYGTPYGEKLRSADFSTIDEDWYDATWKPKQQYIAQPHNKEKGQE